MNGFFAIGLIFTIFYLFSKFAQQEAVEEFYNAVINDVEGRIDWALTRSSYPFGMQANIELSSKLLQQAKVLWYAHKYQQAYQVARQSQKAIDKAQNLYILATLKRQQAKKRKIALSPT